MSKLEVLYKLAPRDRAEAARKRLFGSCGGQGAAGGLVRLQRECYRQPKGAGLWSPGKLGVLSKLLSRGKRPAARKRVLAPVAPWWGGGGLVSLTGRVTEGRRGQGSVFWAS